MITYPSSRFLDQDGNGWISHDELRTALTTKGDKLDEVEFERIISELDVDRDGKIYYEGSVVFYLFLFCFCFVFLMLSVFSFLIVLQNTFPY